jgi:hypothetical protein
MQTSLWLSRLRGKRSVARKEFGSFSFDTFTAAVTLRCGRLKAKATDTAIGLPCELASKILPTIKVCKLLPTPNQSTV